MTIEDGSFEAWFTEETKERLHWHMESLVEAAWQESRKHALEEAAQAAETALSFGAGRVRLLEVLRSIKD